MNIYDSDKKKKLNILIIIIMCLVLMIGIIIFACTKEKNIKEIAEKPDQIQIAAIPVIEKTGEHRYARIIAGGLPLATLWDNFNYLEELGIYQKLWTAEYREWIDEKGIQHIIEIRETFFILNCETSRIELFKVETE